MTYVPGFANDLFISYSHIDNQAVAGAVGWVSDFHQRLQIDIEVELGHRVQIWRDARIGGADDFARDLERQVRGSAVMIAVVSPGYRASAWCEREAKGFAGGALRVGDLWIDTKCRVVKVVKRPVELTFLPETTQFTFFDHDRASEHVYELEGDSQRYKRLISDLAQEVGFILRAMRKSRTVFLGAAAPALAEERERVRRELEARAYCVLTSAAGDAIEVIRDAVKKCSLSVLFAGQTGPAAATPLESLAFTERTAAAAEQVRQVVVMRGQDDTAPAARGIAAIGQADNVEWLVDPAAHTLNHTVLQMLDTPAEPPRGQRLIRLYLICDRADHPLLQENRARHLRDYFLGLGFEVKMPLAEESNAAEFSRDNRSKLKQCDGVVLYWGVSRQAWFEQRLLELMQARGWRRGRQFVAVAGYVGGPVSPIKQNYETRELDELIKQFEIFDGDDARLAHFVELLASAV
jgi:hypothetical protein